MKTNYFDERARYWDQEQTHIERSAAIAEGLGEMLPIISSMTALEYGAGTGILSFIMKDRFSDIVLMDNSLEMIRVCEEKVNSLNINNLHPILYNLEEKDYDMKFDVIYNQMVMHHVKDVNLLFNKFYSHLKQGGYLAVADLFTEDGSFHGEDADVHFGFDPEEMGQQLIRIGFKNFRYKSCFEIEREQGKKYPGFLLVTQKQIENETMGM